MTERIPFTGTTKRDVLAKCDFFVDCQVWPQQEKMDPHGWLSNFEESEINHAVSLLNGFVYYNEPMVDALFRAAVQSISVGVTVSATSLAQAKALWRGFLSRLRVTIVTGEAPSLADSGYIFARKARQVLEIDEDQILSVADALEAVRNEPGLVVLFVDDFVGSGNQMYETWTRRMPKASFAQVASGGVGEFYYAPMVATSRGVERLRKDCPDLLVQPAHTLDERYQLTHPDCVLWPDDLRPTANEFLRKASDRAGINTNTKNAWQGFSRLALGIAFFHCVPDATLPLFFWEKNGWTPLLRRT